MYIDNWYSDSGCLLLKGLVENVRNIEGEIIEIGCWEGKSTTFIANAAYPQSIICNDTWLGNVAESKICGAKHITEIILETRDVYADFIKNMNQYTKNNYTIIKKDCIEWLKEFDKSIKFLHIDASHEYESVFETIQLALPKIIKGGIICGDDFKNSNINRLDLHGGVEKAVRESFKQFYTIDNFWFWIKKTD